MRGILLLVLATGAAWYFRKPENRAKFPRFWRLTRVGNAGSRDDASAATLPAFAVAGSGTITAPDPEAMPRPYGASH